MFSDDYWSKQFSTTNINRCLITWAVTRLQATHKAHRMKPPTQSAVKESSPCTYLTLYNKPTWTRDVRQDDCLSVIVHLHLGEPT